MKNLLEITDLTLTYHTKEFETKAINDLNISVKDKDFVSIVGPSGCGKTTILSLIAGILIAYWITVTTPTETPNSWWFIILSGAIAICAMILPGISGAFILLLMGKYSFILGAVSKFDIGTLFLFAIGAIAGIISFSHLLSWLLKNHHTVTISLLTGFMVGSLNKVWPWKETLQTYIDSHGVEKALVESNISPQRFAELTQNDPQVFQALLLCLCGFILIYGIELFAQKLQKKS